MMLIRTLCAALLLVLAGPAARADHPPEPGTASAAMRALDGVMRPDLFDAGTVRFAREIAQTGSRRSFAYVAMAGEGAHGIVATVVFAPAGTLLDAAAWQRDRDAAGAAERARDFPHIGLRARLDPPAMSPEVAVTAVTFTTADGLFDVAVSVAEPASRDDSAPPFTALEAAEAVARAYRGSFE